MTRRMLATMGSATAIAAMVGGCLLLSPTPQAQAADCPGLGLFGISPTCIYGTSGGNTGYVVFTPIGGKACTKTSSGTTCKSF